MLNIEQEKWVIMSKDRSVIAKGNPRDRNLIRVSDEKDKKRVLFYNSKKLAENAFINNGFYSDYEKSDLNSSVERYKHLEAIKVKVLIQEIKDDR